MATRTNTITRNPYAKKYDNGIKIVSEDYDADVDVGTVIEARADIPFRVKRAGIIARRTAGATDVVDVTLQGRTTGGVWETIATGVSSVATTAFVWAADFSTKCFEQYRIDIVTIGAGNTLDVTVYLGD